MKENRAYTIIEISIIIIVLSLILAFTTNIKITQENNNIKRSILEIKTYTTAINNFKRKFGYLPGDIQKTKIFNLSVNDTNGNQNNLVEDKNQQQGIIDQNIKADGEISNFWLHLYKSEFLNKNENIFPYIDMFKTGILVFSNNNKNYYHLAVNGSNIDMEIETINNLTPNQAYLIDTKFDDGLPFSGIVTTVGGSKINNTKHKKISKKCATEFEYLTVFKQKLCQLIMEIDI